MAICGHLQVHGCNPLHTSNIPFTYNHLHQNSPSGEKEIGLRFGKSPKQALRDGFQNQARLVTTNRGSGMLPKFFDLASGAFVPEAHPIVAFRGREGCRTLKLSSSGGGLFGRPVISQSGALLIFALTSSLPVQVATQPSVKSIS